MSRKNTFSKISILLILFFIFTNINNLSAIEIKQIYLRGNSINLETEKELKQFNGSMSRKDIEAIGIKITNEYHERGYTTSFVERMEVEKDGSLIITIKESRILEIKITGIEGDEKEEILRAYLFLKGTVYNTYFLEKTAESTKFKYNLESIKIYPVNYNDTSDIFLSIDVGKKSKGNFYGGIGFEPVYGITPELGYYYPFTDTSVDLYARASYREEKIRRAEGDIKFFIFPWSSLSGIYAGSNIAYYREEWQSLSSEYKRTSLSPVMGLRTIFKFVIFDIYFKEIISNIDNYKDNGEKIRDYDSRLSLELGLTNKTTALSKKDVTDFKLSVSSGKNDLNKNMYFLSSAELTVPLALFTRLRIIPGLYSFYTSSEERYFWQYVFDNRLLGFFNDFSASKWKNTAGVDIEYEIVPQSFYTGPFVNAGYFLDENLKWKSKIGGGVFSIIEFTSTYIEISYAWDLSGSPAKGGVALVAGGQF